MLARKIKILCLQETRMTGGKSVGNWGDGCKLYYSGGKQPRNSVEICLSDYWQDKVIAVERSDRIIAMKMIIHGMSINIISAYAVRRRTCLESTGWNNERITRRRRADDSGRFK